MLFPYEKWALFKIINDIKINHSYNKSILHWPCMNSCFIMSIHCKKSYRQIPTNKPDDARPNDQADGICLQQACWTFLTYLNTKVGLFRQVPSPKSDFSDMFHLSWTSDRLQHNSDFSDNFEYQRCLYCQVSTPVRLLIQVQKQKRRPKL